MSRSGLARVHLCGQTGTGRTCHDGFLSLAPAELSSASTSRQFVGLLERLRLLRDEELRQANFRREILPYATLPLKIVRDVGRHLKVTRKWH
jgi:hypothetical protein